MVANTDIVNGHEQRDPIFGGDKDFDPECYVIKRDGTREEVCFDKITERLKSLTFGLDNRHISLHNITMRVMQGMCSGITTVELDTLGAEIAASMTTKHPDYAILAARLAMTNLHKETCGKFSDTIEKLYKYYNYETKLECPMVSKETYDIVMANKDRLNEAMNYDRDMEYHYFGLKTLMRSYLLKVDNKTAERPQQMLMRVAIGIHADDIDAAIETYNLMSEKWFTHASPTLFNAGTPRPQMSSCFLLAMRSDSIEGIFDTLKQCAVISKWAGGIGVHTHCIRAGGSYIAGTNGRSNGLVPMLRVYNNTARYVDQGGNKRPGSIAVYLEPWHADIFGFLDLKKNTGQEELRARDLFFALWIPDLFMERVQAKGTWSLMCPHECPGLSDCYGDDFKKLYESYEAEGKFKEQIPAMQIWKTILSSQIETGTPYMLYKDSCNRKSNQKNLGVIKCSNLCTEIVEYTSPDEIAVCNLASIALNKFVVIEQKEVEVEVEGDEKGVKVEKNEVTRRFDFERLRFITKVVVRNLNKVIDRNFYPLPEAKNSNMRHRPIGIGIQGLADCFMLMRYPYESDDAVLLNKQIFETIYYAALEASCELAEKDGVYSSYEGSPISKGILQFDMWGVDREHETGIKPTDLWNWDELRAKIKQHGVRNSLLLAPMPTASTAQILGNNESYEPFTSNIYSRRVLSGEFQVVNPHLLKDLTELKLWNDDMKNLIIAHNGSIQNIDEIPSDIKALYKTAWEVKQMKLIQMAADRGAFIDQSQSFNLFLAQPTLGTLTTVHFNGWRKGLKTGMYYLRTKPAAQAIQFTVDQDALKKKQASDEKARQAEQCRIENGADCISCGS